MPQPGGSGSSGRLKSERARPVLKRIAGEPTTRGRSDEAQRQRDRVHIAEKGLQNLDRAVAAGKARPARAVLHNVRLAGMGDARHNRLIAEAARSALRPAGLRRKGRSRTWLDDHGWWVGVIEFQPSAWSKGTYLNVGVTWLWHPDDDPAFFFDLSHRVEGWVEYGSDDQFRPEAARLASRALEEVASLRSRLGDVASAAKVLSRHARREKGEAGWATWDAAVAFGLAGDARTAETLFARVTESTDDRQWWQPVKELAERWRRAVSSDQRRFRREVVALITRNREALRLGEDHPAVAALQAKS